DWSLQPADMVELPINQRLAQIRCHYTIGVIALPARLNRRQVPDIETSQVAFRVAGIGIADADVQGRREGMIADIRCVVARAARARYRRKAKVVVDAGDTGNVNGCGVEESLPTRNGRP